MLIGYARVSTDDQSLEVQETALAKAGCERVFGERKSGSTVKEREALALALSFVREGDVLVVTRLDRLARSIVDLRNMLDDLKARGVGFRCLEQGVIDTTTSHGQLMATILGAFAEFELAIIKERQKEGIAKAKAKGVYNRPKARKVDPAEVRRLRVEEGLGATAIAKRLGSSRQTVWRAAPGIWGETPAALKRAG